MGVVLTEPSSWCFCSGGGRSERVKGSIFSTKAPAVAVLAGGGIGLLLHRSLLLTSHANLPSAAAAEAADVRIQKGKVPAKLAPQRFFITSSVLDLTIVGLDIIESETTSQVQQPHYLKSCGNLSLELGSVVYILGEAERKELTIGDGKVVIATDNLIKFSTDGVIWSPGSAGFDVHGNLAFMVCDPMKHGSSPTAKSSSTSSSSTLSWKKELPMQFGIPMPIICDWLYQHWEGSLDELSKPKLPLRRLISTGQRSEHSCASFNMRSIFKPTEEEKDDLSTVSQINTKPRHHSGTSSSSNNNRCLEGSPQLDPRAGNEQRIRTPEIYESPSLNSGPVRRNENAQVQLLDINFPPKAPRSIVLPLTIRQLLPESNGVNCEEPKVEKSLREKDRTPLLIDKTHRCVENENLPKFLTQEECCSEVQSSSPPLEASRLQNGRDGFSSDEETMYSAETMESRNYPSPRRDTLQQVRRSQSCVSYSRWGSSSRNSAPQKLSLQKQQATPARKTNSQTAVGSQRSHDYYSPTVSSIMKKRNNSEPRPRTRRPVVHDSPKWMF